MANLSRMNRFGRWFGLTRETTSGTGMRFFAKRGFVGPYLWLHATEGSETMVDIQGFTSYEASSTAAGSVALSVRGITGISSGASTLYTLAAASPSTSSQGYRKTITATSSSTLVRQITSAVPIIVGKAVGGTAGLTSASSVYTVMNFTGQAQTIELMGFSTAYWQVVNIGGFATDATPLTTV